MSDGTGTDPSTDRCPDCGHLLDVRCGCDCCTWQKIGLYLGRRDGVQ